MWGSCWQGSIPVHTLFIYFCTINRLITLHNATLGAILHSSLFLIFIFVRFMFVPQQEKLKDEPDDKIRGRTYAKAAVTATKRNSMRTVSMTTSSNDPLQRLMLWWSFVAVKLNDARTKGRHSTRSLLDRFADWLTELLCWLLIVQFSRISA